MEHFQLSQTWRAQFEELHRWVAEGDRPVERGHVKAPRGSGKTRLLPINAWAKLKDQGFTVLYITNPLELERLMALLEPVLPDITVGEFAIWSYSVFLAVLRLNSAAGRDGVAHAWLEQTQPDDLVQRWMLPPKLLLMIDLDVAFGADFSLGMALLDRWARHQVRANPHKRVRILTMSSGDHWDDGLWCLFEDRQGHSVRIPPPVQFSFPASGGSNPLGDADLRTLVRSSEVQVVEYNPRDRQGPTGLNHQLKSTMHRDKAKHNLVLCPDFDLVGHFSDVDTRGSRLIRRYDRLTGFSSFDSWSPVMRRGPWRGPDLLSRATLDIVHVPRGPSPIIRYPAQTRVHLVLERPCPAVRIVTKLGLLPIVTRDGVSWQEQLDQLAFVSPARRSPAGGNVFTVYLPENQVEGYGSVLEAVPGSGRARSVDHEQHGGLLCALTEYREWQDVDIGDALVAILEGRRQSAHGMACLIKQRVLETSPHFRDARLAEPLYQRRRLLYRLLPVVQYDYRLAVLLSLPSGDKIAMRIKAQLAAMLVIGCDNIVELYNHGQEDREATQSLAEGYTADLAGFGTWWLLLGLIKVPWREIPDYEYPPDLFWMPVHPDDDSTEAGVMVDGCEMLRMKHLTAPIYLILMEHGFPDLLDGDASPLLHMEPRYPRLEPETQQELEKHLLHAFLFGLVAFDRPNMARLLVSDEPVYVTKPLLDLHSPSVWLDGQEVGFGLTNEVSTKHHEGQPCLAMKDLVLIPDYMVEEWVEENYPGKTIFEVLGEHGE